MINLCKDSTFPAYIGQMLDKKRMVYCLEFYFKNLSNTFTSPV